MPTYIPQTYKDVEDGQLPLLRIEIKASEVAETGQRFITFSAQGEGGCQFEACALPQGMELRSAVREFMDSLDWHSVLFDIPF